MREETKTPLIYEKMSAVMKAITHIGKDQQNQHQKFNFRGIDDLYNSLHGILSEHGVFNVPEVLDRSSVEITTNNNKKAIRTLLRIKYTFYAEDGSSVYAVMDGESIDHGDKSVPQAAAIAHKYALLQTFSIPTKEQKDPDHNCHDLGSAKKPEDNIRLPADQEKSRTRIKVALSNDVATVEDLAEVMKNEKYIIDKMPTDTKNAIYTNFAKRGVKAEF